MSDQQRRKGRPAGVRRAPREEGDRHTPRSGASSQDACGRVRIVIADDHPIVREGLSQLLGAEPGLEVVGQAADGVEAIALVRELKPDILMLDLAMPRRSGMEVLQDVTSSVPSCRVIVLAGSLEPGQFVQALQFGARGIVMKDAATKLLCKSIPTVMAGQYWVGRESLSDVIGYLRTTQAVASPSPPKPKYGLTPRELQIMAAVVAGYTNKDIAGRFSRSEDTIKHHLSNIFDKLGVSNRLEAALFAINHHLVDDVDAQ
jgi:DNA-binding NarL/FixJ family response regulator